MFRGVSILIVLITIFFSCDDGTVITIEDPSVQREIDSIIIADYFLENGYPLSDDNITESGVRFVILEQGSDSLIGESDNVSFDYVGFMLNDTIFDTSIQEIADSIRIAVEESIDARGDTVGTDDEELILLTFREERDYLPLEITYSTSGWPYNGRFVTGFSDGITATFNQMGVGGKAIIAMTSSLAYGSIGSGLIPGDEVIAFELYPVAIERQ